MFFPLRAHRGENDRGKQRAVPQYDRLRCIILKEVVYFQSPPVLAVFAACATIQWGGLVFLFALVSAVNMGKKKMFSQLPGYEKFRFRRNFWCEKAFSGV